MVGKQNIDYLRVAQSIEYLRTNFDGQPNFVLAAKNVNLSLSQFEQLFSEWAGTSPQNFLQYTSLNYAKHILNGTNPAPFQNTQKTRISSSGRTHDFFLRIVTMSPDEILNGGIGLGINYSFASCIFGNIILASTNKGLCYLAFVDNENEALATMKSHFPNSHFDYKSDSIQKRALNIFTHDWTKLEGIALHVKGTDFQHQVWKALLHIPLGELTTYGAIAEKIGKPKASRAVGTAIGNNPVAFLIPCHRVIQSTGTFGKYMWGNTRKTVIIGWEGAKVCS